MTKLRKVFTVSVMFVTVLSMSVVAAPGAGATAAAGDLIKMDGLSSVYYLGADGKRYVFPNESTYFSWYSDFSGVVTIPQSELESYPLGANVTVRPGTKLVKITTNPKVYAVESDGSLVGIPDEATALALYGASWNKRIIDVPDAFFTNYTISDTELTADAYPEGSMIQREGESDIYYINADGTASKIADEAAMLANRLKSADVISVAADYTLPTLGADVTGADDNLIDTSQGGGAGTGITPGAGTGLTVALSSTTAAASTLVAGQAIANLASYDFTAASDGAVKVTSVRLKRIGVSADATLAAAYLYEGVNRLTDSATVSSTYISWNNSSGIFTVAAGATRTITVKSNIAASTSGQTVGVQLEAVTDIGTDGAAVSGSAPVSGNLHSIASATLATVSFNTTTTPNSDGAPSPQDEFRLWQNTVDINTRAVDLNYITFRQIGSVTLDDLQNFKFYIAGVQVGETVARMDANGYVTFDLSDAPYRIETGSKEFKILVDLVGGSGRTTSLSLRQTSDISVTDTEYEVPILVQANSTTFSARTSTTQNIAAGSLTITKKTDSPSGNVVDGASSVTLGTFEFKAAGESIKVETLRANVVVSDGNIDELRNGKIFANGVQVGSTADIYASDGSSYYTEYSLGSSLIINPGNPVTVSIVADIYDSDGTDHTSASDTIQAQIGSSTSNAQRMTSLTFLNAPSTDKAGNTMTVKTGSLTGSKYTGYTNHTVVDPQNAYKIGEFRVLAGTSENVNITSFNVDLDNSSSVEVDTSLSDVYLVYGGNTTVTKATVASTSNSWNVNYTISSGDTLAVAVYADIESAINANDTLQADLTVNGTTVSSATAANSTEAAGQTITIGSASIATAATETPLNQIVYGGQTVTVATYDITATNDDYTLEKVCIKFLDSAVTDVVSEIYLYDDEGTLLNEGGTPLNGVLATTTGLSLPIAANTTETITVKLGLNDIGTGAGTAGRNASTTLEGITTRTSSGTETYTADDRQGNEVYVYKSYPVVTQGSLTSTTITGAVQPIYKFTVSPSAGGDVYLKQLKFDLSWTNITSATLNLSDFKFFRGATDITATVDITTSTGQSVKASGEVLHEAMTTGALIISWKASEEQVSTNTEYTIKAKASNFSSSTSGADKFTINMVGDSTHNLTKKYAVASVASNKVWKLDSAQAGASPTAYNFIWSDKSVVSHSAASDSSSADWFNGYLIEQLNLDGTTLSM